MALILNLGCGAHGFAGCLNADRTPMDPTFTELDLDDRWPWDRGSVSAIYAVQVFEHVRDPDHFMRSAATVLEQGGPLVVTTPDYRHPNSFTDPTHVRHCTDRSFDYWCAHTDLFEQFSRPIWGEAPFEKVSVITNEVDVCAVLRKA